MAENEEIPMTKTKEKILFETNELVVSLNTQVAVLTNSNNALKSAVEAYMDKLDKKMDKLDERDATMDSRITFLRNDLTKAEGRIDNIVDDVRELKSNSTLAGLALLVGTIIAGVIAWFK